ncbi:MAG: NAD-dependent epimerase/dehydratase family protein [Bacteroidia bacterium]|nr:MAG: NAD-dependent epimerase/dehydratase family protein [Bacteroidia bacterium]
MKKALLLGATGLVGKHLLQRLLDDPSYGTVVAFLRRPTGFKHSKLKEHIIDFDAPDKWQHLVEGDVLFLCLGTTRAKAGSKQAQYKVDHTYQYRFAEAASKNGVPTLLLVSSAGARLNARFFYMRMKAELERDIADLSIRNVVFVRPAGLTGARMEKRVGENIGVALMRLVNRFGIATKYRPIHADIVARAMLNAASEDTAGVNIFQLDEVFTLAGVD